MNRVLGVPFWIAAHIAQRRARLAALRQQDRAYRQACAEATRTQARRRLQLNNDIAGD